jgi:hypothetical protein
VNADTSAGQSAPENCQEPVRYEDFGAVGDGKADDLQALAKAHAHANREGLPVRAKDGATYYLGGGKQQIVIQTDTDFGAAKFVIDDREVENHRAHVFVVRSKLEAFVPKGLRTLARNQAKIDVELPAPCLIQVSNSKVRRYIRYGRNQNKGSAQTDVFLVDAEGNVDPRAPIVWDFERITKVTAYPLDSETLRIHGGRFTTIANAAESKYSYYGRGIAVRRSRVVIDGLEHRITGEGKHGAPYGGFVHIASCAHVIVQNTTLTGHKTYRTIGRAGLPVTMGSYDISLNRAIDVAFVNCRQTNDIKDSRYWGIMGSNFCKLLSFDNCTFSRFDAHQGVVNATIRNSTLGYMGINAIGFGTFTVENSTIYGRHLINLRSDYGSTWRGDFVIRNCTFVPSCGRPATASLIGGYHTGKHDFGYTCYMPERITIDKLHIDDSRHPRKYRGPAIFANFNQRHTSAKYSEDYPQVRTQEVVLKNITTASGKALRLSDNTYLFRDVKVTRLGKL